MLIIIICFIILKQNKTTIQSNNQSSFYTIYFIYTKLTVIQITIIIIIIIIISIVSILYGIMKQSDDHNICSLNKLNWTCQYDA